MFFSYLHTTAQNSYGCIDEHAGDIFEIIPKLIQGFEWMDVQHLILSCLLIVM